MPKLPRPRTLFESVKDERRKIHSKLVALGVCNGLSRQQHVKLANEVSIVERLYGIATQNSEPHDKRIKQWFGRTPGQLRKVRAKVEKVRTALADLRDYVRAVGSDEPSAAGNVYLARVLYQNGLQSKIAQLDIALDDIRVPPDAIVEHPPWLGMGADDPRDKATELLVTFFSDSCGLTVKESEVRTAKIGNAVWGWNVDVKESYEGGGQKGSDAIRKRLKRKSAKSSKDNFKKSGR